MQTTINNELSSMSVYFKKSIIYFLNQRAVNTPSIENLEVFTHKIHALYLKSNVLKKLYDLPDKNSEKLHERVQLLCEIEGKIQAAMDCALNIFGLQNFMNFPHDKFRHFEFNTKTLLEEFRSDIGKMASLYCLEAFKFELKENQITTLQELISFYEARPETLAFFFQWKVVMQEFPEELDVDPIAFYQYLITRAQELKFKTVRFIDMCLPTIGTNPEISATHYYLNLKVEEETYKVPKLLLATISPVFQIMLTNGMRESKQNEIEIREISKEVFSHFCACISNHGVIKSDASPKTTDKWNEFLLLFDRFLLPNEFVTEALLAFSKTMDTGLHFISRDNKKLELTLSRKPDEESIAILSNPIILNNFDIKHTNFSKLPIIINSK